MEPDVNTVEQAALAWPEKASQIIIHDQYSYTMAAKTLLEIAKVEKNIKAHHEPIKAAAFTAHRTAVAAEKKFLDPLSKAKSIIKKAISAWEQAQAKIRIEAERKALEEAQRKEEDERLARAVEAEKAGKTEAEVEKIIDTPAPIETPVATPTFKRVAGVGTRETWHAEVIDMFMLCKAVVDGKIPTGAVRPDMPFLNSIARSKKDYMEIPGVKAVKEVGVTTR